MSRMERVSLGGSTAVFSWLSLQECCSATVVPDRRTSEYKASSCVNDCDIFQLPVSLASDCTCTYRYPLVSECTCTYWYPLVSECICSYRCSLVSVYTLHLPVSFGLRVRLHLPVSFGLRVHPHLPLSFGLRVHLYLPVSLGLRVHLHLPMSFGLKSAHIPTGIPWSWSAPALTDILWSQSGPVPTGTPWSPSAPALNRYPLVSECTCTYWYPLVSERTCTYRYLLVSECTCTYLYPLVTSTLSTTHWRMIVLHTYVINTAERTIFQFKGAVQACEWRLTTVCCGLRSVSDVPPRVQIPRFRTAALWHHVVRNAELYACGTTGSISPGSWSVAAWNRCAALGMIRLAAFWKPTEIRRCTDIQSPPRYVTQLPVCHNRFSRGRPRGLQTCRTRVQSFYGCSNRHFVFVYACYVVFLQIEVTDSTNLVQALNG